MYVEYGANIFNVHGFISFLSTKIMPVLINILITNNIRIKIDKNHYDNNDNNNQIRIILIIIKLRMLIEK